jgi:hypothetical protein
MGLETIFERCSEPKEANRQIGPLFKRWLNTGVLGIIPVKFEEFYNSKNNAILDASDAQMMAFAKQNIGF